MEEYLLRMREEEVEEIVGKRFEYNEDMKAGKVNVKNYQRR